MILVDTNIWSAVTKRRGEPRVIEWLARHETQLHLSVLVIAEIRRGIELPRSLSLRPTLERWLAGLELHYASRTVPFDARDAHVFGSLAAQRTLGRTYLDIQMAAQAIARDCVLATRNVQDFAWTGARLVNPWEG